MSIEVTARDSQIHASMQRHAHDRAAKIGDDFSKVEHVNVVLDCENRLYRAEFVVRTKGGQVVGVGEHAENIMTAIDEGADKIVRQMRKQRDKQVDTRHSG